jgi:cyclophilin family peptidyl-prolyl cis-trans isomerase
MAIVQRVLMAAAMLAATAAGADAQTRPAQAEAGARTPGAGPVIVVETVRGTFEIETYPADAPRTVEHVLALVRRRFYNGLRVHRAEPGFVVQMGDPNTRDYTKQHSWGTGGSGTPVGASEVSPRRRHVRGAVAMAHSGDPTRADAQFYITLVPVPRLNGKYAVFGRVISGMDVVAQLRVGDVIRRATVKE